MLDCYVVIVCNKLIRWSNAVTRLTVSEQACPTSPASNLPHTVY